MNSVVKRDSGRQGKMKNFWKRCRDSKFLLLFLLPAVIWYVIFCYTPMYGLVIAFKDYTISEGILGSKWVGLKYFNKMFNSPDFLNVLRNTLVISGLKMIFVYTSGLALALIFNEVRIKSLKSLYQDISTIPKFLSWVIIGSFMTQILSPSTGIVNAIIKLCGGEPIYFLANPKWFVFTLIISDMWQSAGWNAIIYTSAIAVIDVALYEAAVIDGASRWSRMWHITLPGIIPVVIVMMIMNVGSILNAGFDQIFNLYNPAVYSVGDIIDTYVYRQGIGSLNYSYSTAVGLFKNVVGLILVMGCNKIAQKFQQVGFW